MSKKESWMNVLSNPIGHAIKKFIIDLLGARSNNHQRIVEQVSRSVFNETDYEDFAKFIAEVYEAGYMRAIDEHQTELTKLGLKVTLKRAENKESTNPLF